MSKRRPEADPLAHANPAIMVMAQVLSEDLSEAWLTSAIVATAGILAVAKAAGGGDPKAASTYLRAAVRRATGLTGKALTAEAGRHAATTARLLDENWEAVRETVRRHAARGPLPVGLQDGVSNPAVTGEYVRGLIADARWAVRRSRFRNN